MPGLCVFTSRYGVEDRGLCRVSVCLFHGMVWRIGDCAGSVCGYFPRGARELPFVFFPLVLPDFQLLRNRLQGRHFVLCDFDINLQLLIHNRKGTLQFMFTCDGFMCVHITHKLS